MFSFGRFLHELRRRRLDLAIDLQGLLRTGVMALATGAKRRVGLEGAREKAHWFYTDVISVADFHNTHAVDRYWRIIEALGAGSEKKTFHVPLLRATDGYKITAVSSSRPGDVSAVLAGVDVIPDPRDLAKQTDIDLIVIGTTTPDMTYPATAAIVQQKLGMHHGIAFDIQSMFDFC